MPVGIGAGGLMGIAFETTLGTYVAPTKFFPIISENFQIKQEMSHRRVIRQIAAPLGAVKGNSSVEAEVTLEVLPDVLPYFLHAGRTSVVKTGTGPWTYTVTGTAAANPTASRSLSVTIVRNGVAFGYVGCIVGSHDFSIKDGVFQVSHKLVGMDEATQSVPTATWPTTVPFGMGSYTLKFNTVTDTGVQDVGVTIDDGAVAEFRLAGTAAAELVRFADNTTKASLTRDFLNRTEYDAYKALTSQAFEMTALNGSESVKIELPKAIMETYEMGLSNPGDLVRAKIDYQAEYDATVTSNYRITVVSTTENIT